VTEVEAFEMPIIFVAVTVKVYEVPSLKPVIVQVVLEVVHVAPVFEVTVYPVIAEPPFDEGAVQAITDCFEAPELAVTDTGAPGIFAVVALADADAIEVPTALVAVTVNV
jgi:hypothetical protein